MDMSLMEMFANPEYFDSLSFGDKMAGAGITTLMGMGITFIVLLLLWGCITVMSRCLGTAKKKEKPVKETTAVTPAASEATSAQTQDLADQTELVAVITAAIMAMEGNGSKSNLVVRKISRISGEMPAWASAGHSDCIESRKL